MAPKARFHVLTELQLKERQAGSSGDVQGDEKIPLTLCTKSAYRDPDAIKGGTWRQWSGNCKGSAILGAAAWPRSKLHGQYPRTRAISTVPGAFKPSRKD